MVFLKLDSIAFHRPSNGKERISVFPKLKEKGENKKNMKQMLKMQNLRLSKNRQRRINH